MSCCARCGESICTATGKIALNKVWHKCCFCCYSCNKPLQVNNAKIFFGEVFCCNCYQNVQQACPLRICKIKSTPSFNPDCCPPQCINPVYCSSTESDNNCGPRDCHSCGCIPICCKRKPNPCFPYNLCSSCSDDQCQDVCSTRVTCLPAIKKPHNYPPRGRSPRCNCGQCCRPKSPRKVVCQEVCPPRKRKKCVDPCTSGKKKILFFKPCSPNPCSNQPDCYCNGCRVPVCKTERCRRCGEKVFAAEKILTSTGAYHLGCFSCNCCCKSLCVKTMYEGCGEIYCKQCYNTFFGINGYGFY